MTREQSTDEASGEVEHDMVPRVIEDPLPDCPVCDDRADASLSGERYQLETEPACELRTCYDSETDTVWIHVQKIRTDGGRSAGGLPRRVTLTDITIGRAIVVGIVVQTGIFWHSFDAFGLSVGSPEILFVALLTFPLIVVGGAVLAFFVAYAFQTSGLVRFQYE